MSVFPCVTACVSLCVCCVPQSSFFCVGLLARLSGMLHVFSLCVFTFTHHSFLIIPSTCFPSLGYYPHPDAGNFHPFFSREEVPGRKQKVCSVDE